MPDYQPHPAAEIFPLMAGADFDALVEDIQDNGLLEPIVLLEGQILDGRPRYRACQQLGIEPMVEQWDDDGSPQAYAISKNLHRRHLNPSQRAMIAAKLANMKRGEPGVLRDDVVKTTSPVSMQEAADMMGVSRDSVINARRVLDDGTPEEKQAVEKGEARLRSTVKKIRDRTPKPPTKKKQKGKDPRVMNMRAQVWKHLKSGLTDITSLPLPADVVSIVKEKDKTGLVDDRLVRTINWLKEFQHEWTESREPTAQAETAEDHDGDAGNGVVTARS